MSLTMRVLQAKFNLPTQQSSRRSELLRRKPRAGALGSPADLPTRSCPDSGPLELFVCRLHEVTVLG
jgi:hypothetical protein